MRNVVSLVLGGGRGTRLYPLTKFRSKPAVPIAGKYRLIDIPLSNCISSGVNRIYLLTQFNSVSLHRHIRRAYTFDPFDGGFVEILAAQQTLGSVEWYQGTADAVRQNLSYIRRRDTKYVLILSGDQLYRMDFRQMMATHEQTGADVTISAVPVYAKDAAGLGIMRLDDAGRVTGFLEKPKTEEELEHVRTDPAWIDQRGVESRGRDCLASMGIYLFNRDTLLEVLEKTDYQDFGKEVFPASIRSRHVQVHLFDGYWEDIGTIRSFYEANLMMASPAPPFELATPGAPVYTRPRFLPPTHFTDATVKESQIADGCVIGEGSRIENSVIGLRSVIGKNVLIRNSIIMGNDFYETQQEIECDQAEGLPPYGVGEGTVIDSAIIDKNCRIGCGVRIVNDGQLDDTEEESWGLIRDGIVVIPKSVTLPDGWKM